MNIKIELVKTKEDYQKVLDIRREVFIEEQNVPENIEIEYEDEAFHVLASDNSQPIAT